MKTQNESKRYVAKDLNSAVEIILMLCITAGGYSLVNV